MASPDAAASKPPLSTISVDFEPSTLPECIIFPPRKEHTATVFFLHGLGDSAKGFSNFISSFTTFKDDASMDHVKLVFPSAPKRPLTAADGRYMNAWFDYNTFDTEIRIDDKPSLSVAASWLNESIRREQVEHQIPPERIIIGGFSQGGSLALLTALTTFQPIAGVFVLGSTIQLRKEIQTVGYSHAISSSISDEVHQLTSAHVKTLPIFWGHGTSDPQVPHAAWKQHAKTFCAEIGGRFIDLEGDRNIIRLNKDEIDRDGLTGLRFLSYPDLDHYVSEEETKDLNVWIGVVLEWAGVGKIQ